MAASTKALRAQWESANQRGTLLGYQASWSIEGVHIPIADLKAMLARHNLSDRIPAIASSKAITRALEAMLKAGYVRQTANDDTRVTYQYLYSDVSKDRAGGDADAVLVRAEARVTIRRDVKAGEDPLRIFPASEDTAIRAKISEFAEAYLDRDITRFILAEPLAARAYSFGNNRNGGSYVVLADHAEMLLNLKAFVEELAQSPWCAAPDETYLTCIRIVNDEPERIELRRHAENTVLSEMAMLAGKLDQLVERKDSLRSGTAAGYIARVDDVMKRANLYVDWLGMDLAEAEAARAKLVKSFAELEDASRGRVRAPVAAEPETVSFE